MCKIKWLFTVVHAFKLASAVFLPPALDPLTGQDQVSLNGMGSTQTQEEYTQNRRYALSESSNDQSALASAQHIILRSGYSYEEHYVEARDGYITLLLRIINPKADRSKLRQPPVMMVHGGLIDSTCFLWASAIEHLPEKYPRTSADGPMQSVNRSFAFTLANHGFDVWLAGTRGANEHNQGHIRFDRDRQAPDFDIMKFNLSLLLDNIDFGPNAFLSRKYWHFNLDHLVQFELPSQIDRILEHTGASNLSLITYSLGVKSSIMMLASNLEYAQKVHNFVAMGPPSTYRGSNLALQFAQRELCRDFPTDLGTLLLSKVLLSTPSRVLVIELFRDKQYRYSLYKTIANLLEGPSAKYHTLLELPIVGHTLMSVGFMELKHYCQQVVAEDWSMYDYGELENLRVYNTPVPPEYNISNIHVDNWMLIYGTQDNLATAESVEQMLSTISPKPKAVVRAVGFNHLDLSAAFQVANVTVLPMVDFLVKHSLKSLPSESRLNSEQSSKVSRGLFRHIPVDQIQNVLFSDLVSRLEATLPKNVITPEVQRFLDLLNSLSLSKQSK